MKQKITENSIANLIVPAAFDLNVCTLTYGNRFEPLDYKRPSYNNNNDKIATTNFITPVITKIVGAWNSLQNKRIINEFG